MVGGENAGSISYDARIDTSRLSADARTVDRQMRDVGDSTERASKRGSRGWAAFTRTVKLASVAVAAAATATTVMAVKQAADYEQSRVAFETMLGSAKNARKMLSDIATFAQTTPFELPGVVEASKQLLAFGVAQKDIIPTLRRLGDIAAGVGVPVGQLSYVYGQVRLTGKLMAQDLMQFTNAGVPLLDYLSKTMHKTTAQIKKDMDRGAGPSFKQVQVAIEAMTNKGGKFGGMMEKQSHTFSGVVSNIKDGFGQMLRSAAGITVTGDIIKGSLFDRLKQVAEKAMPAVQKAAKAAGPFMIQLIDHIASFVDHIRDSIEFVYRNRKAIMAVVGAITAFFIPALVKAGVTATVTGTKSVVASIMSSTAWIRSAVMTSARFYIEMGRVVASMSVTAAKAVIHATAVSATWVASAAKTSAVWVVKELPNLVLSFALTAAKAVLYAADTSLAWVLNAIRVSTVWTVKEMPKLVASFVVTAARATVYAAMTSAVWIAHATKTSVAWVVTELPKIVASFVVTAASATAQATVSSTAWVVAASRAAIAWVVTQLPRIVAAFATTSAAAVIHAAITSGAWTAAAVKSTKSFVAFRALVASPIAMGAIAIAGALADIALVMKAVQSVRQAISDMNAAKASAASYASAKKSTHATLLDLAAHGDAGQKARAKKLLKQGYAEGGFTGRGAMNEVAGIVHRGEFVLPKRAVNQETGLPKAFEVNTSSTGPRIENHIQNITINDKSDADYLLKRLTGNQEDIAAGLVPRQSYGAAA